VSSCASENNNLSGGDAMFIHIKELEFPKKLLFHVCSNDGHNTFYYMTEHLISLGETRWPESVKGEIENIFKEIGIEEPLRQKLVEPFACAFGGIKDDSGDYKFDKVNWEHVVDYFRWEALSISGEVSSDDFYLKARELQDQASKKYGSKFLHYLVYANPDYMKTAEPNISTH
jgi:hypothetical protein